MDKIDAFQTTWGQFQAVIQLGAGLNFGFSSLEPMVSNQLKQVESEHASVLVEVHEKIRKISEETSASAVTNVAVVEVDAGLAVQYGRMMDRLEKCRDDLSFVESLNPYMAVLSGSLSVIFLVGSFDLYNFPISKLTQALVLVVGYEWILFVIITYSVIRFRFDRGVLPALSRIREELNQ